MENSTDFGHWVYPGHIDVDEWFGFVYRIIDHTTGMHYIGKKQFWKTNRKIVKDRKRRKVVRKESDWKKYVSSSEYVKLAIETHGKENFTFLIESLHKTKASLHYAEVELQVYEDVLRAVMENGEKKFFNKSIGHIKFIPPEVTEEEKKFKISTMNKRKELNKENESLQKIPLKEIKELKKRYNID